MMKIGLLKSGVIADVIKVRDTRGYGVEGTDWVDMAKMPPRAGKGWDSDGSTATAPVRPATYRTKLAYDEWVNTFSQDEWEELQDSAYIKDHVFNSVAVPEGQRRRLRLFFDAMKARSEIDIKASGPNKFYGFLVTWGYIDSPRRAELQQGIQE